VRILIVLCLLPLLLTPGLARSQETGTETSAALKIPGYEDKTPTHIGPCGSDLRDAYEVQIQCKEDERPYCFADGACVCAKDEAQCSASSQ
jgi:hypothetical protein